MKITRLISTLPLFLMALPAFSDDVEEVATDYFPDDVEEVATDYFLDDVVPVATDYFCDAEISRYDNTLAIDMTVLADSVKVEGNRAVVLTPILVTEGNDSIALPSVGLYSRRRFYHYQRRSPGMITGDGELTIKAWERPAEIDYHTTVAYTPALNGARLILLSRDYGCCNHILEEESMELAWYFEPAEFRPQFVYKNVAGEGEKTRSISGSALIRFEVDKTAIRPEMFENPAELGKIRASIDSVRGDADITINEVWLKGFASPESPYSHNRDLAEGRTRSVQQYVNDLYRFAPGIVTTDYEPEDWAGLRRYVETSNLANREGILELIDRDMNPDAKEAQIKKLYPQDYKHLLEFAYPPLRHTEYRIDYTIREFSDVEEIRRLVKSAPQKLSLNELYLAAGSYEEGTDEYNEVYETAVRMYPGSEPANINAANRALARGDLERAATYLSRAGESAEAEYARALLAIMEGDYSGAEELLKNAQSGGIKEAEAVLEQLDDLRNGRIIAGQKGEK